MSKSQKQLLLGISITAMLLTCIAMAVLFFFSGPQLSNARFFYAADVHMDETIEESFDVDGPAELDLSNLYGDIRVVGTDDNEMVVTAVKNVWGQNQHDANAKLEALKVRMDQQGDKLIVEVYDPDKERLYLLVELARLSTVDFEISVPQQTAVKVASHNGNIVLDEVLGSVTAESYNGDVTLERSGGDEAEVKLSTEYGDITVRQVLADELSLDSHNGNLSVESVVVEGKLSLKTEYGRSTIQTIQVRELLVRNQNGDITVLDGQTRGRLDLSAYGAVKVNGVEAAEYRIETKHGDIKLIGAGGRLWLHTEYGGDINVTDATNSVLDLYTHNGQVRFEGSLSPDYHHQIISEYGEISLRLPRNTAVLLDASTEYGDITCEFEVDAQIGDDEDSSGEEFYGPINNGSARLMVNAYNGNIVIELALVE